MHILLTNDDGLTAPGLLALKQALAPLGQVTRRRPVAQLLGGRPSQDLAHAASD